VLWKDYEAVQYNGNFVYTKRWIPINSGNVIYLNSPIYNVSHNPSIVLVRKDVDINGSGDYFTDTSQIEYFIRNIKNRRSQYVDDRKGENPSPPLGDVIKSKYNYLISQTPYKTIHSPYYEKCGDETHELYIVDTISTRMRDITDKPLIPGYKIEGDCIRYEIIKGPTPYEFSNYLDSLNLEPIIRLYLSLYTYLLIIDQLSKLNKLSIYHIDNHGKNFILSLNGVYIIDFDIAEDILNPTDDSESMYSSYNGIEGAEAFFSISVLSVLLNSDIGSNPDSNEAYEEIGRKLDTLASENPAYNDYIHRIHRLIDNIYNNNYSIHDIRSELVDILGLW